MKKLLILIAAILALAFLGIGSRFLYTLVTGPRMTEQIHLRAYQAAVPQAPQGSVPATAPATTQLSAAELTTLPRFTEADLARGKTYFTYYCVFCHGEAGDGRGPVGESYDPAPADLRSARVQSMTPQQLVRSMLTGTGHEPVLEMIVHPQYRADLVRYVRTLAAQSDAGRNRR